MLSPDSPAQKLDQQKCRRDYSNSSCSVVALITCLTTLSTLCRVGLSSNVSRKDFPSSSLLDTRGSSGIDPAKARCVWKLNGKRALYAKYYPTLYPHSHFIYKIYRFRIYVIQLRANFKFLPPNCPHQNKCLRKWLKSGICRQQNQYPFARPIQY